MRTQSKKSSCMETAVTNIESDMNTLNRSRSGCSNVSLYNWRFQETYNLIEASVKGAPMDQNGRNDCGKTELTVGCADLVSLPDLKQGEWPRMSPSHFSTGCINGWRVCSMKPRLPVGVLTAFLMNGRCPHRRNKVNRSHQRVCFFYERSHMEER
jgi:hypothetical protein